ncbi:aldehyde dehydrogenase family protein [Aminobacter carboxidus]|uniref:Aldehyde dehydrogenase n=1 Tax=Aminobacter carboxidus TaxID=376165 RepID=A0ABR9GIJ2_9HYPH|nr:aldehyde dehydrogenase family protein [Aminobacter carboxidus]MBE1203426.1 aldehyde dehydrogenase [Aminobacter carboxidus]
MQHSVVQAHHFIAGKWTPSHSGQTFEARSPYDGSLLAVLAEGDRSDAQDAIKAAEAGHNALSQMSAWDRARLCNRVADVIEKRRGELALILAREQGKPLASEAYGEIDAAATGFREAAELIKWLEGEFIPVETPGKRAISFRQARGVYAIVTPWNFPINIPVEYLAPCLAAGNAVVWVPAPTTSLCAVKLMECIAEAGLPDGAVNLVLGPGAIVGDEIVSNPGTHGIGFTGSPQTGSAIAKRGAGKPMLLELGGNGPVIVLDDADLDRAAQAAAFGCFFNAGQVCAATGRILVTEKNHDTLAARIAGIAETIRLGDPLLAETTMGPLNNPQVVAKVEQHVADGLARGANLLTGGKKGAGLLYHPTVMGRVDRQALLNTSETFGPVAPLVVCADDADLLDTANASSHGLAASVFTRDLSRAFSFGEKLQAGLVNINSASCYWELHLPFGGASGKASGLGRLGGKHTLREVTDVKTITFDIS